MVKYADPRMLKQRNRSEKDVTSPITDLKYRIRKINVVEFIVHGPLPLAEWAKGKELDQIEQEVAHAAAEAMERDPGLIPKLQESLLALGVVTPKVVLTDEAADDEVFPEDLGDDQFWLAGEIMTFNGLLNDEQASRFRRHALAIAGLSGDQV